MIKFIHQALFKQGSHEDLLRSFQAEYIHHRSFIRTLIFQMIRNEEISQELVQDTFVKAWRAYPKFKNNSSFKTWIYSIAKNTCHDYFKKHKIKTLSFDETQYIAPLQDLEMADLISKATHQLPRTYQEVFILRFNMELNYSEIAELLHLPEGTVKSRIHKAKSIFKDFLKENGVTS